MPSSFNQPQDWAFKIWPSGVSGFRSPSNSNRDTLKLCINSAQQIFNLINDTSIIIINEIIYRQHEKQKGVIINRQDLFSKSGWYEFIYTNKTDRVNEEHRLSIQVVNCEYNTDVSLVNNVSIGDNRDEEFGIKVVPNPTTGIVTINIGNLNAVRGYYSLFDISGQGILLNKPIPANYFAIDISNFANGIYFLKVQTGLKTYNIKICKT